MYCACDTSAVIGPVPPRANARQGALSALKGYSRLWSLHDVFAEVETWTDRESRRESAIPQEIAEKMVINEVRLHSKTDDRRAVDPQQKFACWNEQARTA